MGDEFRTDNAMEACRRFGLRCKDCLPRNQWCDLCDYRQQVIDATLRMVEADGDLEISERRSDRPTAVQRISGSYTGLYEPGYLDDLRAEWQAD